MKKYYVTLVVLTMLVMFSINVFAVGGIIPDWGESRDVVTSVMKESFGDIITVSENDDKFTGEVPLLNNSQSNIYTIYENDKLVGVQYYVHDERENLARLFYYMTFNFQNERNGYGEYSTETYEYKENWGNNELAKDTFYYNYRWDTVEGQEKMDDLLYQGYVNFSMKCSNKDTIVVMKTYMNKQWDMVYFVRFWDKDYFNSL